MLCAMYTFQPPPRDYPHVEQNVPGFHTVGGIYPWHWGYPSQQLDFLGNLFWF
jgi:hypothetical protein